MTPISDALAADVALLNQFSEIIRTLIKRTTDAESQALGAEADRDNAKSQLAALLQADQATAAEIIAQAPQIQSLIDEALAAIPPTPVINDNSTVSA